MSPPKRDFVRGAKTGGDCCQNPVITIEPDEAVTFRTERCSFDTGENVSHAHNGQMEDQPECRNDTVSRSEPLTALSVLLVVIDKSANAMAPRVLKTRKGGFFGGTWPMLEFSCARF